MDPKIIKIIFLTVLGLICIVPFGGTLGGALYGLIQNAFGQFRYFIAGMIFVKVWVTASGQSFFIEWLAIFILGFCTTTLLYLIRGDMYGQYIANFSENMRHLIGVEGLVLFVVLVYIMSMAVLQWKGDSILHHIQHRLAPSLMPKKKEEEEEEIPVSTTELQSLLDVHGVRATVVGHPKDGVSAIEYRVKLEPGTKKTTLERLQPDIALGLGVETNQVRVSTNNGHIIVSVDKKQGRQVLFSSLLDDLKFMKEKNALPIGMMTDGPLYAFLDKAPHLLVAGTTGAGKTVFLRTAIVSLALKNTSDDVQFILIDGVRRGLKPLARLPHSIYNTVISEDSEVISALEDVVKTLNERIQSDTCEPRLITVIDEIDTYYIDKKVKKELEPLITKIVKAGRQFGVHLIMGSQRPSGDLISPHVISMMKRVCLKVELPKYSQNIIESPKGAQLRGDGDLLYLDAGQLISAQGYYLPTEDLDSEIDRINSGQLHPDIHECSNIHELNRLKRTSRRVVPEYLEEEKIKELYENGLTIQQVASELDLSYSRVQRVLAKIK